MKHRTWELIKDILIVLLIVTLLLLALAALPSSSIRSMPRISRLLHPIAPLLGWNEAELTYVAEASPVTDAAAPIAISIMNDTGRHTVMWNFSKLDSELDHFSSFVTQALTNSKNFRQVSDSQVQSALKGSSLYLRYDTPQHPSVLASWFDSKLEAAISPVDRCILAAENGFIVLYLLGETSYAATTNLSAEPLLAALAAYEPDGSMFAFEGGYALSPLSLIPGSRPAVPALSLSVPLTARSIDSLATDLGFNPYGESRYTDDSGVETFSEEGSSLVVRPDGAISYRSETAQFSADTATPEALTQTAVQFVEAVFGSITGEGRLYLSALTQEEDRTICKFDYYISGVPLVMPESAVVITFTEQAITEAHVAFYTFTATGKMIYPLPIAQAAALLEEGQPLEMTYRISADGVLSAGWSR